MRRKHQDIAEDIAGRLLRGHYGEESVRHTGPSGDRDFRVAMGTGEIAVEVKLFTDEAHQRLRSDWERYVDTSTPIDTAGLTRSWVVSLSLPMIGQPAPTPNLRTFRDELPGRLQVLERAGLESYDGLWPGFATDDEAARKVLASMPGVTLLAYDLPEGVSPMVDLSTSWGGAASLDGERILSMIEDWLAGTDDLAVRLRRRLGPEPVGVAFLVLWLAAPDSWRFDETRPPARAPQLPPEIDGLWLSSVDAERFAWSWTAEAGWSMHCLP